MVLRIWIDDVRPAPEGYVWFKSVDVAMTNIAEYQYMYNVTRPPYRDYWKIELIDIDHDAGEFAKDGGDYIKLLDWFEATNQNYPIRIHSMNPVGRENMRVIIRRNGWKEIL